MVGPCSSINYYVSQREAVTKGVPHIAKFPFPTSSRTKSKSSEGGQKNIINERTEVKFDNNFCNLFRYLRLR